MPTTKPDLAFDLEGVCSACRSFESRSEIDWDEREKDFAGIIETEKGKRKWDCIVPVSGGKDSTYQVIKVLEYNLRPLCVTSSTCDLSDIGRRNIENIKSLGVDYLEFSPNKRVRRTLNRIGLETVGDISWPEHVGIFTIPVRVAVDFKIPLIIWGENSQNEYGGPNAAATRNILDRRWLEEFGGLLGLRTSDLPGSHGITESDLTPYTYPEEDELAEVGIRGLFLGHYFPWDSVSNSIIAQASGFESFGRRVEGSMLDSENLDNYQHGIHDYFKFLKYGYARATDHISMQIRRNRISRTMGVRLAQELEGKYPKTYLDKTLENILTPIGLTTQRFDEICDAFTNRSIFKLDVSGRLVRDSSGNLIKTNYDNLE